MTSKISTATNSSSQPASPYLPFLPGMSSTVSYNRIYQSTSQMGSTSPSSKKRIRRPGGKVDGENQVILEWKEPDDLDQVIRQMGQVRFAADGPVIHDLAQADVESIDVSVDEPSTPPRQHDLDDVDVEKPVKPLPKRRGGKYPELLSSPEARAALRNKQVPSGPQTAAAFHAPESLDAKLSESLCRNQSEKKEKSFKFQMDKLEKPRNDDDSGDEGYVLADSVRLPNGSAANDLKKVFSIPLGTVSLDNPAVSNAQNLMEDLRNQLIASGWPSRLPNNFVGPMPPLSVENLEDLLKGLDAVARGMDPATAQDSSDAKLFTQQLLKYMTTMSKNAETPSSPQKSKPESPNPAKAVAQKPPASPNPPTASPKAAVKPVQKQPVAKEDGVVAKPKKDTIPQYVEPVPRNKVEKFLYNVVLPKWSKERRARQFENLEEIVDIDGMGTCTAKPGLVLPYEEEPWVCFMCIYEQRYHGDFWKGKTPREHERDHILALQRELDDEKRRKKGGQKCTCGANLNQRHSH